jgi:hypothetical protein
MQSDPYVWAWVRQFAGVSDSAGYSASTIQPHDPRPSFWSIRRSRLIGRRFSPTQPVGPRDIRAGPIGDLVPLVTQTPYA